MRKGAVPADLAGAHRFGHEFHLATFQRRAIENNVEGCWVEWRRGWDLLPWLLPRLRRSRTGHLVQNALGQSHHRTSVTWADLVASAPSRSCSDGISINCIAPGPVMKSKSR